MSHEISDDPFDRLPPHNLEAEMCLLAAFLLADKDAIRDEIIQRLKTPEAFYLTDHKIIGAAMFAFHKQRRKLDAVTLRDELKRVGQLDAIGGAPYVAQILSSIPSAAHWSDYLDIVLRMNQGRWLINIGEDISRRAYAQLDTPAAVLKEAATLFNRALANAATNAPPDDPIAEVDAMIEDAAAGRLTCMPFPWPAMTKLTQALRPGTLTVFGGAGGDSKSFKIMECLTFWIVKGIRASLYALEDDRAFHLARVMAQLSGGNGITDYDWIRENADEARQLRDDHTDVIRRVGLAVWDAPKQVPTLEEVAAWIRQRSAAGDRIVMVDPITRARVSDRRHVDDEAFVGEVAGIAKEYGNSIIAVTHPAKNVKGQMTMGDLAGGAAYSRFAQCVLFLKRLEKPRKATCVDWTQQLPYTATINRELKIFKARSAHGIGKTIGFEFDSKSLCFHERGQVLSDKAPEVDEKENAQTPPDEKPQGGLYD